jgi:hypothetical protein
VSEPASAATVARSGGGFLGRVERFGNALPDPVLLFVWLMLAVVAISVIGQAAGWQVVNPVNQQTLAVTSLLSSGMIERLFVEMPRTLTSFAPLGYVLLVMLGAGLAERTGLFGAAMRAAVRGASPTLLTPLVLFVGIRATRLPTPHSSCCSRWRACCTPQQAGTRCWEWPWPSPASPADSRQTSCRDSSTRCCSASRSQRHVCSCRTGR